MSGRTPSSGKKASVQFMITNENKRKLYALGYGMDEVEVMEPALAMSLLKREMKRPWGDKPMPEVTTRTLK